MAINSLSASSYGLSGLVSGMNSQDMVQKLLSGTQSKIDAANQKKMTLQTKQSMYREVSTKLKALQSGFLSFTSKTNLLSNGFYNNMSAAITTSSSLAAAFSVTASSNARVGTTTVNSINQLAQAYARKTTWDASGSVSGLLNKDVAENLLNSHTGADATLNIQVGSDIVSFTEAGLTFEGKTTEEVAAIMNEELKTIGAQARVVNNKLTITSGSKEDFIRVYGSSASGTNKTMAMQMFGSEYSSLSGQGTLSTTVNTDLYQPGFTVNLDGRQQTIRLGIQDLQNFVDGTDNSAQKLVDNIQKQLMQEFGAGVKVEGVASEGGMALNFTPGTKSQTFTLTGTAAVMGALGLKSGISNKLNTGMSLKDLNFATGLEGSRHSFTINGVGFSYTSDTALSAIINDINSSKAGVNVRYIGSEDRFVIERAETGLISADKEEQAKSITFAQTEGNLLSVLFGADGASTLTTTAIGKPLAGAALDSSEYAYGGVFTFNVDGKDVKFTVPEKANDKRYTLSEFASKMNSAFRTAFGTLPDGTQVNEFRLNDDGNGFEIVANNGAVIKANAYNKDTNHSSLGFDLNDATVVNSGAATLEEMGIRFGTGGGIKISFAGAPFGPLTLTDAELDGASMDGVATLIQDKINGLLNTDELKARYGQASVQFDTHTGGFRIQGLTDTTTGKAVEMTLAVTAGTDAAGTERLFGKNSVTLGANLGKTEESYKVTDGQNAVLTINNEEIIRAGNTFDYDGLTFTLNRETTAGEGNTLVTTSRDTDAIVEGITDFLKQYNETVDYLNGLYKADTTYKDYPPLTAEQKASMSDREIELWEEKSREGMLRNDPTIGAILEAMRKSLYTKPEGSSIALYNMGIDTSYYANDGNFKEVSAGAIKAFVEKDPEGVHQLFAGDGGIMELLNNSINDAIRSGYGNPGSLVRVAGANGLDTNSTIYKQIKEVDSQLVSLESRYWKEYDRYWKQFNTMEQLIQQMNTQSSWLSSQFAS